MPSKFPGLIEGKGTKRSSIDERLAVKIQRNIQKYADNSGQIKVLLYLLWKILLWLYLLWKMLLRL